MKNDLTIEATDTGVNVAGNSRALMEAFLNKYLNDEEAEIGWEIHNSSWLERADWNSVSKKLLLTTRRGEKMSGK